MKSRPNKLIPIAVAVLFILAAAVAFYPLVSNALAERNRSLVRTEYAEQIEQTDEAELENILAAAREYNAILTGAFDPNQGVADYYDQLTVGDSGIMGYIEIPKIDVYLPIYHGTDADTLDAGVGHLTLNALGTATGDIGQMCLSAISRTVLSLQRQNRTLAPSSHSEYASERTESQNGKRSEYHERTDLHDAGRL